MTTLQQILDPGTKGNDVNEPDDTTWKRPPLQIAAEGVWMPKDQYDALQAELERVKAERDEATKNYLHFKALAVAALERKGE